MTPFAAVDLLQLSRHRCGSSCRCVALSGRRQVRRWIRKPNPIRLFVRTRGTIGSIVNHIRSATILTALLALGACSGSSAAPATTESTTPPTTVAASTSTSAAPTTTVEATTTSTTIPADPVMPLTGLPVNDPALASRPALVVKIDNHSEARPQFGLNAADIVFEENVEKLTRFAAVFQSTDAERVGPIRSGRTQDVALLGSLNKPLFGWSGGNPNVTRTIGDSDLVSLNPSTAGNGFFRSKRGKEAVEHTLYNSTPALYAYTPVYAPAPPQQFTYRKTGETAAGDPSAGVDVAMDGVNVRWQYDTASGTYQRFMNGQPHNDATLGQVNAVNVISLVVDYVPSPADARSPEAQTEGTGEVFVFSGGKVVRGTWTRDDRLKPFTFTGADGKPIALAPGRTWVELARVNTTTPLPA
jgi:Protein of unknown function (DUF3048) N-terminal domain/Protein of unknown function (DUF3048) C-terminal domain